MLIAAYGEIAVEGHNIKLGRGGIREIEFFVQTQQLIAGGRHSQLRGRGTVATLAELAERRLDRCRRPRRIDVGLRSPSACRAPLADASGRADPHTAGRPRGARRVGLFPLVSRAATTSPGRLC